MSDAVNEPVNNGPAEGAPAEGAPAAEQKPAEGAAEQKPAEGAAEQKPEGGDDISSLPAWAQKEIADRRKEAASWRVQYRDLQTQAKDLKSPEDFEKAIQEHVERGKTLERELTVERLCNAKDAFVPEPLRKFVTGNTEEEVKQSIKEILDTWKAASPTPDPIPPVPSAPGGGLNGTPNGNGSFDAEAEAARIRDRRFR